MIPDIQEINFPSYATISSATATLSEMGDKTIQAQVKIDGAQEPNFSGRTGTTAHGTDWEVEFKGERYIQPLRKPQMAKGNDSIMSVITLTFHHWAIYQLKRYLFCTLQQIDSNTAIADKYEASVSLNLYNFCKLLDDVIKFYFPGSPRPIYVDYSGVPQGGDVHTFEISKSYIWDVLINSYDIYGSRWTISADQSGNYKITFNAQQPVIAEEFSYGHAGKLSRLERQVQDGEIRNQLIGRGGEKNLPYLYFKDYEKFHPGNTAYSNHGQIPDPDAIPELENVYFDRLRDANFRSYIQGWKVNTHRKASTDDGWSVTWTQDGTSFIESDGTTYSKDSSRMSTDWAYAKGATDTAFDPVEYVKDESSINTYGLLQGGLEDNDEIYPTLQGMIIQDRCITARHNNHRVNTPADKTVEVEEVFTDEITQGETQQAETISEDVSPSVRTTHLTATDTTPSASPKYKIFRLQMTDTYLSAYASFSVPEGYYGFISKPVSATAFANVTMALKYDMALGYYTDCGSIQKQVDFDIQSTPLNQISVTVRRVTEDGSEVISNWKKTRLSPGEYTVQVTLNNTHLRQDIPGNYLVGDYKNTYISSITPSDIVMTASVQVDKYTLDGDVLSGDSLENVSIQARSKVTERFYWDELVIPEGTPQSIYDISVDVSPSSVNPTAVALKKVHYFLEDENNETIESTIHIQPGTYTLYVDVEVENTDITNARYFDIRVNPILIYNDHEDNSWKPTFDIWIKNIFGTNRASYPAGEAGDAAYVNAVWQPLVAAQDMAVVFTSGNLAGHSDWEFKLAADGIHYDPRHQYVIDEDEDCVGRSEWRLTLIKTDAEKDSIHKYVPYKGFNAKAGDTFFLTGINLPWDYVRAAESALRANKTSALEQTADTVPTWVATLDKVKIFEGVTPFANQIVPGAIIEIDDDRFGGEQQDLMIETVSYTWQDGSQGLVGIGLPTVEMTITKELRTTGSTVQQIQGQIDELSSQVRNMTNLERLIKDICDATYLRKNGVDDVSYSPTVMSAPIASRSYANGAGWILQETSDGTSYGEVDVLTVRKEMRISTLVVNQISTRTGKEILSAASLVITGVEFIEEDDPYYRCYYDNRNYIAPFAVNDYAMCQRYNAQFGSTKYYRKKVIGLGDGYIELSTIEGEVDGTGAPEIGDVLVQYGNDTNTGRQFVIERNVIGTPYERMLRGLNSVDSNGTEFYYAGLVDDDGEKVPRFFVGSSSQYMEWFRNTLTVAGKIIVKSGSSGLSNFSGYSDLAQQSDIQYLMTALDEDTATTQISGGMVLSTFIGVKDGSNNLKAALNASSLGADNTQGGHGKLLIFAGSTNAEGAASATTRIYEDGHIVSTSANITGTITATAGQIAGFAIGTGTESDSLIATKDGSTLTMRGNLISFRYGQSTDATYLQTDLYAVANMAENKGIDLVLKSPKPDISQSHTNIGAKIVVSGANSNNIGVQIDSDVAIQAVSGMFQGFRPYIENMSAFGNPGDESCVIMCDNSSARTLTLPSAPKNGQFYMILHLTSTSLTVSSSSHKIVYIPDGRALSSIQSTTPAVLLFWYNANYAAGGATGAWIYQYIYNIN